MKIKQDCDSKLEDAKIAQDHQASLVERLRVSFTGIHFRVELEKSPKTFSGQGCGLQAEAGVFRPKAGRSQPEGGGADPRGQPGRDPAEGHQRGAQDPGGEAPDHGGERMA